MSSSFVIYLSLFAGPLIAGLAAYVVLSYLFVPIRMTVPLAITISVLILGLSKYYAANNNNKDKHIEKEITITNNTTSKSISETMSSFDDIELKQQVQQTRQQEIDRKEDNYNADKRYHIISETVNYNYALTRFANLSFVIGYAACLLVVTAYFFIFNPSNEEVFVPWEQFTIVHIIGLGTSIALCFFLPGYALLEVLFRDSHQKIRPLLKFLLAYLLSILITGLTGYIAASAGIGISDIIGFFIAVYSSILIVRFIQISATYRNQKMGAKYFLNNLSPKMHTFETIKRRVWDFTKRNSAKFTVFASIFALVILSTYFLYLGAIIGDQWYHHGRSLAFMSGDFRDMSIAGADEKTFSPFPSALLASFFSVSGIPSVNAYASISFLNIMPVLAFYYFFKNCVPIRMKRAALLACTLFMLSSGFGWVYVLDMAANNPPESQLSAMEMLYQAGIKSIDIILPTSFSTAHPDFSTPLLFMTLPAGFTLLGLLREDVVTKNKFKFEYLIILLSITLLGLLSHDEFYLFIIVSSIIPIFLFFTNEKGNEKKKNFVVVYGAQLSALLITVILSTYLFAGVGYFFYNKILGIPLLVLCFIFITIMCILYIVVRFLYNLLYQKKYRNGHLHSKSSSLSSSQQWVKKHLSYHRRRTTSLSLVLVFIIAWLYVFTFIVWSQLSVEAVEIQTYDYTIPWYLYPMKLGVTGLLGIAFILSYLLKKFEKEIFIFGIIVVVAFVTGSYYDEHRFSKYIMAGLAGFASLFIYNVIIQSSQIQENNRFRILATSLVLGIVIFSSALSIFMFWGYNASAQDSEFDKALGRRDFPSESELGLFNLLRNGSSKDPLAFNVAAPANEYAFHTGDLIGKVHAFSGVPWNKLLQSPLTLNASTLEGFYDLLHRSDTRYIVLPKEDFINQIAELGKDEEIETMNGDKQQKEEEGDKGQRQYEVIIKDEHTSATITDILRFALENLQKIYEDGKYIVLAVPPLTSPQSQADIGFIIPRGGLFLSSLLPDTHSTLLHYNNYSFKKEEIDNLEKSGKIEFATIDSTLHGDKGETATLWSNPLKQNKIEKANYIEATFRIIGENETNNDAGIIWNDKNQEYTASVRNDRLEVLVKPIDVSNSKESFEKKLVNVREIKRENGLWYTLKVITLEEYVNVYINDILAVQVPRESSQFQAEPYQQSAGIVTPKNITSGNNHPDISKVGLFSFNNIAEFKPIRIGQVPLQLYEKDRVYFGHYYPLNMLSLSKLNYDTFIEGDPSVFSKKIVVMDMDSFPQLYSPTTNITDTKLLGNSEDGNLYLEHKASDYNSKDNNKFLEFAKKGGTLIITDIVNPDNDYFLNESIFQNTDLGKLFSIQAGGKIIFDKITQNVGHLSNIPKKPEALQQPYLNVSGVARDIKIKNVSSSSSDFKVISSYMLNNKEVAPFALEKKYGAGKVIVINSGGYFNAIASSPKQYFHTLGGIFSLINLNTVPQDNNNVIGDNTLTQKAVPITRVVGDLKVTGHSVINSSSLSILGNKTSDRAYFGNDKFRVHTLFNFQNIADNDGTGVIDTKRILQNDNYTNFNTIVRDLKLYGDYEVVISLNGSLVLPSTLASHYDYIAASIPTGFNMIIKLHDGATAEFIAENGEHRQPVRFTGEAKISFYNVMDLQDKKNIPILLKSPDIRVINGRTNFEKIYMHDPYGKIARDGGLLDTKGSMVARFDRVDNYNAIDSSGEWINTYDLTYLKSIHFGKNNVYNNDREINLEIPADISALAKKEGVLVPWQTALLSGTTIVTSLFLIVAAVTLKILRRPR